MTKNNTINSELVHKSHRPALKLVEDQTLPDFVLNHRIKVNNLNYPCFTDALTKESMTYEELHSIVPRLASGLHNNFGIVKDDIVAMFVPNHINFGATMLGITDLGAKISPVNYVYTPNELANLLKLVKPKLLFTVPELLEISQKALEHPELANVKLAFLTNEGSPQFPKIPNFKQILSDKPYPKLKFTNTEKSKKQVAAILFSSGTTGIPKGVMLSHFNLIANMQQIENVLDPYYQPRATFVTVLPFYHLYAMMTDMLLIMHSACSTNVMKKFDFQTYLEIIDKNEIKLNFVAPPVIVQLAKNPIVENYNIRNLKAFFCAAAPLSKDLEDDIFAKFGIKITQGYGMSELSPLSHCNDIPDKRAGAAGYMVANMEQIVVDVATGKRVGPNKRGELRLKGPNVMMGYYKNPEVTKDMFDEEGFMKTGDIVYIDDDGYIYIVDRLKELIKVKGLQVAPAELEAVLLTHPDVADACVIGVSDPVAGELPRGYITLKNRNAPNKPEIVRSIHKYFGEQLAHYKQLKGGIEIIPEIPKSPSGKILRRKLRDLGNSGKPKL